MKKLSLMATLVALVMAPGIVRAEDDADKKDIDIRVETKVSGEVITATATALDGSTSEFSGADVVARPPVQIDVKSGSDLNPINLANNGVIPVLSWCHPSCFRGRIMFADKYERPIFQGSK